MLGDDEPEQSRAAMIAGPEMEPEMAAARGAKGALRPFGGAIGRNMLLALNREPFCRNPGVRTATPAQAHVAMAQTDAAARCF